ncbi:MAG: MFS transporter, partial [Verrucomicrobiota bacterium]|nr:MFS transporter [Verrucomicrobiota bacterium]
MHKGLKRSLFSLYMAYFADYLTWGVAIAFLAVYITTKTTPFANLYWKPEVALGMAYAAFPIGEIIGSPILGDLSDWIGRKKVLIWGFWGSIFCMLLCAYTLWVGNFALFLVAQLLVGFFSGKQAMAQAAIVESDVGSKAQKLAFLSVIGGVSWVLGPFLGGLVMTQWFLSYGGYIWPSLVAALIYFLSLLFTQWFFVDTYKPSNPHLGALKFLRSIGDVFALTYREKLFSIFLINLLGWYLLIVALSNFLIERFHITDAQVGFYNSYLSLCFTVGGVIGTAWLLRRHRAKNI